MSTVVVALLVLIPLITAFLCGLFKRRALIEWVNAAGAVLTLAVAGWLTVLVKTLGEVQTPKGLFFVDALSNYIILLVAFLGVAASLYSIQYLRGNGEKVYSIGQIRQYYATLHVFLFTMLLVPVSNNLGFLWIGIEATTLASAFLVGFYDDEVSIEAAWKYVLICSVGIAFALFGTILLYYSGRDVLPGSGEALQWTHLMSVAGKLDPQIVKLAFVFILVGYGTKAGLAPMHTWLPDAHSQAPSPVSALLSGVLLNSALYALLRFHLLVGRAVGSDYSGTLLIIFGLLSIAVAVPFTIVQRNFKRLLAYSSIEHVGIIAFGFGLSTRLGTFGALLHMLNNALAKGLLFFAAGTIVDRYQTRMIPRISGVIKAIPITGSLFLLGMFAITGWPPFGLFVSEITILSASFSAGNIAIGILFLLLLTLPFIGFSYYATNTIFGSPREHVERERENGLSVAILIALIVILCILGLWIPSPLHDFLGRAAAAGDVH